MSFVSIPSRSNGQKITYSWFNALQVAGAALESWFGSVILGETSFIIANNQVAAANVTYLVFSGAVTRSAVIEYQIYRNTTGAGATELSEAGMMIATFSTVASSWEMTQAPVVGNAGVTFTITAAGQVQYTSTNITGTPASSLMKFKYRTMGI